MTQGHYWWVNHYNVTTPYRPQWGRGRMVIKHDKRMIFKENY